MNRKPILTRPGYYASDEGKIWGLRRNGVYRLIKQRENKYSLMTVNISLKGIMRTDRVGILMLETFSDPCPLSTDTETYIPWHNNGDGTDNDLSNLQWVTCQSMAKEYEERDIPHVKHGKLTNYEVGLIGCMLEGTDKTQKEIGKMFGVDDHIIVDIQRRVIREGILWD